MRSLAAVPALRTLEDDDGIGDHRAGVFAACAGHETVRIANVIVRGLNLEAAAQELAGLAAKAAGQGEGEIALDPGVGERPAGHGGGADAVELVAQGLPFLALEEFGERHGFAQG